MNYLIYNSSSIAYPHFGVQLDELGNSFNDNDNVYFAYCDGVVDSCFKNLNANPAICKLCKLHYCESLKEINLKVQLIPLKSDKNFKDQVFSFKNIAELKNVEYKGVNIGYSVLSTYISITRNINPEINSSSLLFFNHLINQSIRLTNAVLQLFEDVDPDIIYIYNGRFFENRPLYDLAHLANIQIVINEVIVSQKSSLIKKLSFNNSLPHDIINFNQRILFLWNNSSHSNLEKIKIGERFFYNRRNGLPSGDKIFIEIQKESLLPCNWSGYKKNIVIYVSSEDEFSAVGKEFDSYSLFSSQVDGIKYLAENSKDSDIHFYVRIHPNLIKINYSYHQDLKDLNNKYQNLTIIFADSPISTYAIMDKAEKVIVFGSTTGIEASFWGKPVILLSGALYYYLGACYIPATKEEAVSLVESELMPKEKSPSIKYGYFIMEQEQLSNPTLNVDLDLKILNISGQTFKMPKYLKVFGSIYLSKLISLFYIKILSKFYQNKISAPDKFYEY